LLQDIRAGRLITLGVQDRLKFPPSVLNGSELGHDLRREGVWIGKDGEEDVLDADEVLGLKGSTNP
jgi:hypothetical protein